MIEEQEQKQRTSEQFVEEMLAHGRDWIAITAVARFVRDGRWYDNVKLILQTKGLMPKDEASIKALKEAANKNAVVVEKSRYAVNYSKRTKQSQSQPSDPSN